MNKVVTFSLSGDVNQTKMDPAELAVMEKLAAKNPEIVKIMKVETPRRRRSR